VVGVGFLRGAVECASRGAGLALQITPRRAGASDVILVPHAQTAQRDTRQEAAGALGEGKRGKRGKLSVRSRGRQTGIARCSAIGRVRALPNFACGGAMALGLAIIGVLAGIALGLRYKVLFLVPAVTLAMIFATMIGVARADHFWSIVLAMVVLGTAVQFGYLAGIAIRAAVGSVVPLPHAQVAQRHAP
jgi:hypothetical protein